MREYDTTVVIQPEISEAGREALIAKLGGVLERAGAVPLEIEDIGKRRLAYEIRKFQKGHYLSLYFLDRGGAVIEFERSLRLEASVLRFLTVRVEDEVEDTEARVARARELEATRRERAAERAARQAEEEAAAQSPRPPAEERPAEPEATGAAEATAAPAAAETAPTAPAPAETAPTDPASPPEGAEAGEAGGEAPKAGEVESGQADSNSDADSEAVATGGGSGGGEPASDEDKDPRG